jgi:uncharacterized small protein (DUF1192 family)
VGVVIAAGVLFFALGAAFYAVLKNRQAESDALAKREADRVALVRAETEKVQAEKAKADAQRAASEAKKKEAEAETLAAQKRVIANASDDDKKDKGKKKVGGAHKAGATKVASGKPGAPAAPAAAAAPAAPAAPPKEKSKASKDIDDLLRSFK